VKGAEGKDSFKRSMKWYNEELLLRQSRGSSIAQQKVSAEKMRRVFCLNGELVAQYYQISHIFDFEKHG